MDEDSSKRKIFIDTTSLFDQYSKRGIGRYTRDLLKRLLWLLIENNYKVSFIGFHDLAQNLIEIGFSNFSVEELLPEIEFFSLGEPNDSSIKNITRWKQIESIIYENEPDMYFAPHFERGLPTTKGLKNRFKDLKTVVVVHDVIPFVNNSFSTKSFFHNFVKKQFYKFMWRGVKNADKIITCSDFSKQDIIKYGGGIDEKKIERVYLGVNETFFKNNQSHDQEVVAEMLERFGLNDKNYLFYDSGLETNKGIDNLFEISKKLFSKQPRKEMPTHLVITGGDFYKGIGKEIKSRTEVGSVTLEKMKKFGVIENIITTGRLEESELEILLSKSLAYIYLSEYEGFGFGPIQAMASGIPSIVNNASCLPEITAGGALLVDSTKHAKTVKQIKQLLKNEDDKKKLVRKGSSVAKKYDWEKTAEETLNAIESAFV